MSPDLRAYFNIAVCSNSNSYVGQYPHNLLPDADAPCSHVITRVVSSSSHSYGLEWTYSSIAAREDNVLDVDWNVTFNDRAFAQPAEGENAKKRLSAKETLDRFRDCDLFYYEDDFPGSGRLFGFEIAAIGSNGHQSRRCIFAQEAANKDKLRVLRFNYNVTGLFPATTFTSTVRPFFFTFGGSRFIREQVSYVFGPGSSPVASSTSPFTPDNVPGNLTVRFASTREIRLSWNRPSRDGSNGDIIMYRITLTKLETGAIRHHLAETEETTLDLADLFSVNVRPRSNYSIHVAAKTSVGDFSDESGLIYVETCPENMQREESNNVEDCGARRGFYELTPLHAKSCSLLASGLPQGAFDLRQCLEERLTASLINPSHGFWKESVHSDRILLCPRRAFCNPNRTASVERNVTNDRDHYCSSHHQGMYCSGCAEGYALTDEGCIFCTDDAKRLDVFGMAIALFLLVLIVMVFYVINSAELPVWSNMEKCCNCQGDSCSGGNPSCCAERIKKDGFLTQAGTKCKDCLSNTGRCVIDLPKTVYTSLSNYADLARIPTKLRIFFGFLQVTSAYKRSLHLESVAASEGTTSTTLLAARFGLDRFLGTYRCTFDFTYYHELLLATLVPIALTILSVLLCWLIWLCQANEDGNNTRVKIRGYWFSSFLLMLFLVYPTTSETIVGTFICENFTVINKEFLVADYRLSCNYEDDHERIWAVAYAAVMVVLYPFGVCMLYVLIIHCYYGDIQEHDTNDEELARVKFLIAPYRPKACYFEAYELVRKLIQTSAGFLQNVPAQQTYPIFAGLISQNLTIVFIIVLLYLQPYKNPTDLFFATISLVLLAIAAQFAMLEESGQASSADANLGITFVGSTIVFYLEVGVMLFLILWDSFKYRIVEVSEFFSGLPHSLKGL